MNIAAFVFSLSYTILFNISTMALQYSETVAPLEESAIYVFITFGRIFFVIGIWIVIMADFYMLGDAIRNYYKEKNKGWL